MGLKELFTTATCCCWKVDEERVNENNKSIGCKILPMAFCKISPDKLKVHDISGCPPGQAELALVLTSCSPGSDFKVVLEKFVQVCSAGCYNHFGRHWDADEMCNGGAQLLGTQVYFRPAISPWVTVSDLLPRQYSW